MAMPMSDQQRKEAQRAYKRRWRAQNRERIREYDREWRGKNPDKVQEYERRRWERVAAELVEQQEEQNGGCVS